jgi:hypothetical protein
MRRGGLGTLAVALLALAPAASADRVLMVGTYHGLPGQFRDVQAAVNAAAPGDWILVAPGDYKEANTVKPPGKPQGDDRPGAGVLITKAGLWLRGMNRNTVWIDGTKPGSPRCSNAQKDQVFGPGDANGKPSGRNGILVYKAPGVYVQNLSACNFLNGDLGAGNEIWWDAGQSTGTQSSLGTWAGTYLTATSTYYKDSNSPSAGYGIYEDNTRPPGMGLFANDYASNMNDSAYYIGACPDCSVTLDNVIGEDAPQGYSGTNSGGHVLVENSRFDNNMVGFATGDLNNDDAPGPQDGTCPGKARNPTIPAGIQRTDVCWIFINNLLENNNNPNVPASGIAANVPTGSGLLVYGGRHDVFLHNRFVNNGAWGIVFTPYPDTEQPPPVANCDGGTYLSPPSSGSPLCYYDDWGSELAFNSFTNNGFFNNPSNGDIGEISQAGGPLGPNYNPDSNCFHDNVDTAGTLTTDPSNVDSDSHCGQTYPPANDAQLTSQVACDSRLVASCPAGANYPQTTQVVLHLPPPQPTMPNPCAGAPPGPWCSGQVIAVRACVRARSLTVRAPLAPRERLSRFTAARFTHAPRASVRGRGRTIRIVFASRPRGRFKVTFVQRIVIRGHRESFRFTNVYHGC